MKDNPGSAKWAAKRLLTITLLVILADALVGGLMQRPFPLVVIIPWFMPVLIGAFVILPMSRAKKAL